MVLGFLVILLFFSVPGRAAEPWQAWLSAEAFRAAVESTALKVDLFQEIWKIDPEAKIYGGTSRDFAWFVRSECAKATSPEDLSARLDRLAGRIIEMKEFVVGESDMDVVSSRTEITSLKSGEAYEEGSFTRIDVISPDWFLPGHPFYVQEALQGYVPVEKILLGGEGFARVPGLERGDGVKEIYDGIPTLHYDPRITETEYYKKRENHPILLALRYLRQVAMAYFRLYGKDYPDPKLLFSLVEERSRRDLETILSSVRREPKELGAFLAHELFRKRLNRALKKAFRSYTNPTAAKLLFERFGVDRILEAFGDRIEPYHTLMYVKYRDAAQVAKARARIGIKAENYLKPLGEELTARGLALEEGHPGERKLVPLFHGTETMEAYRGIVFQGNIPSTTGLAGAGVYAVDERSKRFAETWRGEKTLVVKLLADPKAVLVDVTEGAGKEALERFRELGVSSGHNEIDAFADFVGADIVRYPYGDHFAYVIKNGASILGQKGVTFPLLTLEEVKDDLARHGFSAERAVELFAFDPSLIRRWSYLLEAVPEDRRASFSDAIVERITLETPAAPEAERQRVRFFMDESRRIAVASRKRPQARFPLEAAKGYLERSGYDKEKIVRLLSADPSLWERVDELLSPLSEAEKVSVFAECARRGRAAVGLFERVLTGRGAYGPLDQDYWIRHPRELDELLLAFMRARFSLLHDRVTIEDGPAGRRYQMHFGKTRETLLFPIEFVRKFFERHAFDRGIVGPFLELDRLLWIHWRELLVPSLGEARAVELLVKLLEDGLAEDDSLACDQARHVMLWGLSKPLLAKYPDALRSAARALLDRIKREEDAWGSYWLLQPLVSSVLSTPHSVVLGPALREVITLSATSRNRRSILRDLARFVFSKPHSTAFRADLKLLIAEIEEVPFVPSEPIEVASLQDPILVLSELAFSQPHAAEWLEEIAAFAHWISEARHGDERRRYLRSLAENVFSKCDTTLQKDLLTRLHARSPLALQHYLHDRMSALGACPTAIASLGLAQ